MNRFRLLIALLVSFGVIVAVAVTLTGSGTIGDIEPGWTVQESCTPAALGDTSGAVGSASLDAASTTQSVFAIDNGFTLTNPDLGTFSGTVIGSPVTGSQVHVDARGGLGFLVADRVMPPVWATNTNDLTFVEYGADTGQVGNVYSIAVDTFDDSIFVSSFGTVAGVDRYKIIKFTSAGVYVTEFGSTGSGNGQFGGAVGIAVDPADGSVYVGDGVNRRVQKFTTSGGRTSYSYAAQVGSAGTGNGQFGSGTINVTVSAAGDVFATDKGNLRIQKFTSSLVYAAKVTTSGTAALAPYTLSTDGTHIYATILTATGVTAAPGVIEKYDTSLVLQSTLTIAAPADTNTGIGNIAFESDGSFWAQWFLAPYLVHYSSAGVELGRWYTQYPAAVELNTNYNLAVNSDDDVHVLFRFTTNPVTGNPYAGRYVTTFDYSPIPLSDAIESYLEACDPTLGGYTYTYDAATDPNVVFPGWSGDVWTKLKELCAAYNLEIALVGTVITVRDIGTNTLSIDNKTVPTITPSNVFAGRQINIIAQNPNPGGGVMFDAADTGQVYTVDAGQVNSFTVRTNNSPVSLASMVPTDTLPAQPGQYYVVDSSGSAVPEATWVAAGGHVGAEVGDGPGEIRFTLTGPTAPIAGFTGPFTFATSREYSATPTFSVTGNGVTTAPITVGLLTGANESKTTREVAFTFDSPFMDTVARAYDRGVWAAQATAGPSATVTFDVPSADVDGFGVTPGAVFEYADSKWRVTDCRFGTVRTVITATRHVTLGEIDTLWSGQTLGTYDTFWSGYSFGDQTIRPLAS